MPRKAKKSRNLLSQCFSFFFFVSFVTVNFFTMLKQENNSLKKKTRHAKTHRDEEDVPGDNWDDTSSAEDTKPKGLLKITNKTFRISFFVFGVV